MYGAQLTNNIAVKAAAIPRRVLVKKHYSPPSRSWSGVIGLIYRQCYWTLRQFQHWLCYTASENDLEDLELTVSRCPPESIEHLMDCTRFSRAELKVLYRSFKQSCPSGAVKKDEFKEYYAHFFPGDSSRYAELVFDSLDTEKEGLLSFEKFIIGLSTLSRGSHEDRLRWVFRLYTDGSAITRAKVHRVLEAIFQMLGDGRTDQIDQMILRERADEVFEKLDIERKGEVTEEDFLRASTSDPVIHQSLCLFDTLLFSPPQPLE